MRLTIMDVPEHHRHRVRSAQYNLKMSEYYREQADNHWKTYEELLEDDDGHFLNEVYGWIIRLRTG